MLDILSQGLGELETIAKNIGTNLDQQNQALAQVDEKMDEMNEKLETANSRVKRVFDEVRSSGRGKE